MHWGAAFLVSVLIDADGFDHDETTNTVQLKAGHTYTIHKDRTTGHGYEMYLWMTDEQWTGFSQKVAQLNEDPIETDD